MIPLWLRISRCERSPGRDGSTETFTKDAARQALRQITSVKTERQNSHRLYIPTAFAPVDMWKNLKVGADDEEAVCDEQAYLGRPLARQFICARVSTVSAALSPLIPESPHWT